MRIALLGCVVIVAFDALASVAAETFDFSYASLWPVSFALYALFAFLAARRAGSLTAGVTAGVLVAATDATLGWAVSWWIGPGAPDASDRDAGNLVFAALFVVSVGAALGLLGGWLGRRASHSRAAGLAEG